MEQKGTKEKPPIAFYPAFVSVSIKSKQPQKTQTARRRGEIEGAKKEGIFNREIREPREKLRLTKSFIWRFDLKQ
jgi:hypothetical protein